MTDQPTAGLPSQADENTTAGSAVPPIEAALAAPDTAPAYAAPAVPASPPTGPDQPLTAAPAPGADWQSAPPPAGWSTQGGVAYAPAAVQPVAAAASPRKGLRWLVAAVVVVLVAVSASAVFFVVAGGGSTSTVARWAPADSLMYVEARFDLPGDQHDKAGQFLAAFPGFADPSTLDTKLGQIFDNALLSASSQQADFTNDIKPWFGGEAAVSMSTFPASAAGTGTRMAPVHGAILLSVKDAAKASAWLTTVIKGQGSAATYGGVALTVMGTGDQAVAVGVDGTVLIGGDVATVHAIIDGKGADGLASTADYKSASAAVSKDRVGFVYMAMKKLLTAELAAMPAGGMTYPTTMLDQLPAWIGMSARFESDALVLDEVAPFPAGVVVPTDRVSTLTSHLPASTVATYEAHDLGTVIKNAVKSYQQIPSLKDGVQQVLDALDKVGGLDSYISWIGDANVAVTLDGTTVGGGLVVSLPDAKAASDASAKLAALKNIASLSGNISGMPPVKVTSEAHGDATITTIDFGSIKDLQQLSSAGGTLPPEVANAHVAFSYTVTDKLAVLGIGGDTFVKAVLDTKAGSSLADQARYKATIGAAGASNSGLVYVDIASIRTAVVAQLSDVEKIRYNNEVKPYLAPFSAFGFATQDGGLVHVRMILTVTK